MATIKVKTNRAAAKRFRKTSGGFKVKQGFRNHILTKKPTKRKRHLRSPKIVAKVDAPAVQRLLPYA